MAAGITVPVAGIMLACAGWYFARTRKKNQVSVPALSGVDPALIIDESKVTLGHVLGAGGSGVVKQGTLELRRGCSVDVAVKMISTGDEQLFQSEVTSMCVRVRACVRERA